MHGMQEYWLLLLRRQDILASEDSQVDQFQLYDIIRLGEYLD